MADVVMVSNQRNSAFDTIEEFFTAAASGAGARINAFTATNDTAASVSYKAYIVDATGILRAVIPQKIIVPDRFDLGPSVVSQIIPAGGSLRMESSTAESINFYVTGKEL